MIELSYYLAVSVLAVVSAIVLIGLVLQSIRAEVLRARIKRIDRELRDLKENVHLLLQCEHGVSSKIRSHEARLSEMGAAQRRLANGDPDNLAIDHVLRLFERGSDVDDVVGASSLSRTELELLDKVARQKSANDQKPVRRPAPATHSLPA